MEHVHGPTDGGAPVPDEQRVRSDIDPGRADPHDDEGHDEPAQRLHRRQGHEAGAQKCERAGEHGVSGESVEEGTGAEGTDDVPNRLSREQDADAADVAVGPLTKLGERRPQGDDRQAHEHEAGQVEGAGILHR